MYTIGFVGCGNMGGALAKAVSAVVGGENVFLCDLNLEKRDALAKELNAKACEINEIGRCNYVFLGVKPQNIRETLSELKQHLSFGATLISMAAGVSTDDILNIMGDIPLIRIMPNTPVAVGKGTILYCERNVRNIELFKNMLSKAGELLEISENLIDAGSAVSGCGPAFGYMFIEAMADGAVKCGLPRADAIKLAAETLAGAAEMVLKTGEHPEKLKDNVCSPGGSTIAGVHALEEGNFRGTVMNCIIKAFEKTKELSK